MTADQVCLTFNAGSSTLKIGVFDIGGGRARPIGKGKIDFGEAGVALRYAIGSEAFERKLSGDHESGFGEVVEETLDSLLPRLAGATLEIAAHRVVHGGLRFRGAARLDGDVVRQIEDMVPLAPLHQPQALKVIHALRELRPDLLQTASFDTAFHATQQDIVRRLAVPRDLHDAGLRRYGFHGLSYKFIAGKLQEIDPKAAAAKVVAAHLGSGASLCAMEGGASRDCSMGFSALDGIPMATRPGWLDPGAILYLLRERTPEVGEIENFLYHRCGLLGVSGISGDTRELLQSAAPEAREAIDLFCFRIAGEIGRMAVTLGGLDAVVFTAGIGENQPEVRRRVCAHLKWTGLELDEARNRAGETVIGTPLSRIKAFIIPTDEEQVLANEALPFLGNPG